MNTGVDFAQWGNLNGNKLYVDSLQDKVRHGDENQITIHRNIVVKNEEGQEVATLTDVVTRPSLDSELLIEETQDEFILSLRKPPKVLEKDNPFLKQPLDDDSSLEVYKLYKTSNGYRYSPHRYPLSANKHENMLIRPWKLREKKLQILTGLRPLAFWQLCDVLKRAGITRRVYGWPIPSIALLLRIKYRQNVSNEVIAALMNTESYTVFLIFWKASFLFYQNSNHVPR